MLTGEVIRFSNVRVQQAVLGNTDCDSSRANYTHCLQRVQFMVVGLPGMLDTAPKPVVDLA